MAVYAGGFSSPTTCREAPGSGHVVGQHKADQINDPSFQWNLTFTEISDLVGSDVFPAPRNTSNHWFFKIQIGFGYGRLAINVPITDGQPGACDGVTATSSNFTQTPHFYCGGDRANVLPWQEHISPKLQTLDKLLTPLRVSLGFQKVSRYPLSHCMLNEADQLSTQNFPSSSANSL